jgi:hypothetical protein
MGTPENKAAYQRARESLDKHYRESGLEEALNWLEVPCCYEDENAVEDFRKWPLKFPVSVRQVAKLQLFLTQYSCHRQPKLCLLEKCTEIWFNDPGCPFVVKIDNNTGVFEAVRKGGILFLAGYQSTSFYPDPSVCQVKDRWIVLGIVIAFLFLMYLIFGTIFDESVLKTSKIYMSL